MISEDHVTQDWSNDADNTTALHRNKKSQKWYFLMHNAVIIIIHNNARRLD